MIERDTQCWPQVERAIDARIQYLRTDLETAPLMRIERIQGEIEALRWLLRQADAPPVPPIDAADNY